MFVKINTRCQHLEVVNKGSLNLIKGSLDIISEDSQFKKELACPIKYGTFKL